MLTRGLAASHEQRSPLWGLPGARLLHHEAGWPLGMLTGARDLPRSLVLGPPAPSWTVHCPSGQTGSARHPSRNAVLRK